MLLCFSKDGVNIEIKCFHLLSQSHHRKHPNSCTENTQIPAQKTPKFLHTKTYLSSICVSFCWQKNDHFFGQNLLKLILTQKFFIKNECFFNIFFQWSNAPLIIFHECFYINIECISMNKIYLYQSINFNKSWFYLLIKC